MRRRHALPLAAILLLMFPLAAHAGAPGPWQRKALETAQRVWHPTCGQLTIVFGTPPVELADAPEWAYLGQCQINIDQSRGWLGYPEFCNLVLHGAGHAAGMGHSSNPRSIMFPLGVVMRNEVKVSGSRRVRVVWYGVDPRCVPPYGVK